MAGVNFDNGLEELDSELDSFLAEIDDIEQSKMEEIPEEPSLAVWKECIDDNTKHPYYWHILTQEVTWVKPDSYDNDLIAQENALRKWRKRCEDVKKINEERKKVIEERKKVAESQPKATAPRKNPRIELENETNGKKAIDVTDGSIGKIGKFNFLKSEAEQKQSAPPKNSARLTFTVKKAASLTPEIQDRPVSPPRLPSPPKPSPKRPKLNVATHTASGKQRTVTEIAAEIKRKKQQIALTNARIHLQKRVEEQNLDKKALVVTHDSQPTEVKNKEEKVSSKEAPESPISESKKRRIFQEVKSKSPVVEVDKDAKRAIEKEASLLKEKLEFWGGDLKRLSKFQIQIIQLGTRISDFIEGHLSETYIQSKISEMGQMLRAHEENSVPKDWTCIYDREEKKYRYTNKNSGKSQFTHPGEDDDKSSSASSDSEPDRDDDLYEMFQQEIKEIESTVKIDPPAKEEEDVPPPTTPPVSPPPIPPSIPPMPVEAPPAVPPPVPPPLYSHQDVYQDAAWTDMAADGWNVPFPGMPSAPPPPPPDDGMMEAYSPGNSDTEEEEDEETSKKKQEDLGVVSVKAPMRYNTPPISSPAVLSVSAVLASPDIPLPEHSTSEVAAQEAEASLEQSQDSSAPSKMPLKKKKKAENLMLGSGNKKQKKMNSLVAKWNKVNKHADTALK